MIMNTNADSSAVTNVAAMPAATLFSTTIGGLCLPLLREQAYAGGDESSGEPATLVHALV
jgi:hypothetical protein